MIIINLFLLINRQHIYLYHHISVAIKQVKKEFVLVENNLREFLEEAALMKYVINLPLVIFLFISSPPCISSSYITDQ